MWHFPFKHWEPHNFYAISAPGRIWMRLRLWPKASKTKCYKQADKLCHLLSLLPVKSFHVEHPMSTEPELHYFAAPALQKWCVSLWPRLGNTDFDFTCKFFITSFRFWTQIQKENICVNLSPLIAKPLTFPESAINGLAISGAELISGSPTSDKYYI
jgi:hypothetical protein